MGDDVYGRGVPGAYPPQPGMAPPPPPPPGLFPDQAAVVTPPQQPKKRRTGLIIGIVAGVLLLCVLASCAGVIALGVSGSGGQKAIVKQAEEHFTAAMSAVETASATVKQAGGVDDPKAAAAIDSAGKALRTGRDEIAAARAAAERLDASEGKTDYLASLTAATDALDALQDLVGYMGTATGMVAKVREAGAAASKGTEDLNAAIDAGNSSDYSRMKQRAQAASAAYAKAELLFREAAKLDAAAGLDKAAAYLVKEKEQADLAVQMADEGKAGKSSAYNRDIKRAQELRKQASAIGDPDIVKDPKWVEKRLAELEARITGSAAKADQLHAKALKALGVR